MTERIRIRFNLERDDEGWPPADSEYLWAVTLNSEVARVDSIPFFVPNVALDDLVSIRLGPEGSGIFLETLKWSGNSTMRVIPLIDDAEAGIEDVRERLSFVGVELEALKQFGIVAVNVRPSADVVQVKRVLDRGEKLGWWTYEEACVGGAWPQ
ncbi:DUF4265 domain-containing protein [Actinoplanes sp. NPDC049599]|uniref:DUF4265 domain-containing protein n=1 Tax=Actinoplanes sp. NPDC049599 TaxID=3363903 RepID=UPI0037A32D44